MTSHTTNYDGPMKYSITQYLLQHRKEMPEWLSSYKIGNKVAFNKIMSGRVGFYPGCGSDGQLIKIGNQSHSVHVFLYVDYGVTREELNRTLHKPNAIRGYHILDNIEYRETDILPNGKYQLNTTRIPVLPPTNFLDETYEWYCIMYVWERDKDRSQQWGADRFVTMFLCADAITAYYDLFVKEYHNAPWIVLLQDHGFGCNYDTFGRGGLLDEIIMRNETYPQYVLVGENTRIWQGYIHIGCQPEAGGMHRMLRNLYVLNSNSKISLPDIVEEPSDPLLNDLIKYSDSLPDDRRFSLRISDIQRRYNIGYNRAARLKELLLKNNP